MNTSQSGIDLIKKYESFSPTPYVCDGGKWTIGYGHTKGVSAASKPIDMQMGETFLKLDLHEAEQTIADLVRCKLTGNQHAALVSLVFNIGRKQFMTSTILRKLNAELYVDASQEFMQWVSAGGRKLKGLARRRAAETVLFLS